MELGDVSVSASGSGIELRCNNCQELLTTITATVDVDEIVGEAENFEHECEDENAE